MREEDWRVNCVRILRRSSCCKECEAQNFNWAICMPMTEVYDA